MHPRPARSGTPVLVKHDSRTPLPTRAPLGYVLGRNGLFLVRNHPFFQSCTRARSFPSDLEDQEVFFRPRYPKLARKTFEKIVGFFSRIEKLHCSEAAVFLVWDRDRGAVELCVPSQVATVGRCAGGGRYPVGLHYQVPHDLPAHCFVFGDVHSHATLEAFASGTDQHDEAYSAGLHIVVGRIHRARPEFYVDAVVDGYRFALDEEDVIDGFEKADEDVPQEWIEKVKVEESTYSSSSYYQDSSSSPYLPVRYSYRDSNGEQDKGASSP